MGPIQWSRKVLLVVFIYRLPARRIPVLRDLFLEYRSPVSDGRQTKSVANTPQVSECDVPTHPHATHKYRHTDTHIMGTSHHAHITAHIGDCDHLRFQSQISICGGSALSFTWRHWKCTTFSVVTCSIRSNLGLFVVRPENLAICAIWASNVECVSSSFCAMCLERVPCAGWDDPFETTFWSWGNLRLPKFHGVVFRGYIS